MHLTDAWSLHLQGPDAPSELPAYFLTLPTPASCPPRKVCRDLTLLNNSLTFLSPTSHLLHGDYFRLASPTKSLACTLSYLSFLIKLSPQTSFHTSHSVLFLATVPHSHLLPARIEKAPSLCWQAGCHPWWGLPVLLCNLHTVQGHLVHVPAGTEIHPGLLFGFCTLACDAQTWTFSTSPTRTSLLFKSKPTCLIGEQRHWCPEFKTSDTHVLPEASGDSFFMCLSTSFVFSSRAHSQGWHGRDLINAWKGSKEITMCSLCAGLARQAPQYLGSPLSHFAKFAYICISFKCNYP
jgi:hypothetical protein